MYKKSLIKACLFIAFFNTICVQCQQQQFPDKYAESYAYYGETMLAVMHQYCMQTYKYPNIDNLIKFWHEMSIVYAKKNILKIATIELAVKEKLSQKEREKLIHRDYATLNFVCMYKGSISIDYNNDLITICCNINGKNIFNVQSGMIGWCYARYEGGPAVYLDDYCFFDSTDYPIGTCFEFREEIFDHLYNNIARKYSEFKIVHFNNRDFRQIAILKYNKQHGLSSLCPDDIDLENDPYINDVKEYLNELLTDNPEIYEIILPLNCFKGELPKSVYESIIKRIQKEKEDEKTKNNESITD